MAHNDDGQKGKDPDWKQIHLLTIYKSVCSGVAPETERWQNNTHYAHQFESVHMYRTHAHSNKCHPIVSVEACSDCQLTTPPVRLDLRLLRFTDICSLQRLQHVEYFLKVR